MLITPAVTRETDQISSLISKEELSIIVSKDCDPSIPPEEFLGPSGPRTFLGGWKGRKARSLTSLLCRDLVTILSGCGCKHSGMSLLELQLHDSMASIDRRLVFVRCCALLALYPDPKSRPSPSAEMCRGFLFYKFWRILPGIFLEDFSGRSFPQK